MFYCILNSILVPFRPFNHTFEKYMVILRSPVQSLIHLGSTFEMVLRASFHCSSSHSLQPINFISLRDVHLQRTVHFIVELFFFSFSPALLDEWATFIADSDLCHCTQMPSMGVWWWARALTLQIKPKFIRMLCVIDFVFSGWTFSKCTSIVSCFGYILMLCTWAIRSLIQLQMIRSARVFSRLFILLT